MVDASELSDVAAEFRRHFDQYYLGVIPRLLNEDGKFLAFVAMLTAIESLAGVYLPAESAGDRFRAFVATYFPKTYEPHTEKLWQFRNRMIHAFNPTPFLILCGQSRMHLCAASGVPMLNAEDFYADVVGAARSYFTALYADQNLQLRFARRISADDGGRPQARRVLESGGGSSSAV